MSAYLITYDLNKPGARYDDLYEAIKSYGTYCHLVDSTWIVVSNSSAKSVYEKLKPNLDSGDHIFVVDISSQDRYGWLPKNIWDWINKHV
ncbi:hypothetical protein [Agromyces sp. SYSU T00266]|uniref:hypothetical protein n=1 Tax=Agromyces zhanjiangensis TaxID=3158562 RepID=UPI0033924733